MFAKNKAEEDKAQRDLPKVKEDLTAVTAMIQDKIKKVNNNMAMISIKSVCVCLKTFRLFFRQAVSNTKLFF